MPHTEPHIALENVCFTYPDAASPALCDVSLAVPAGCHLCVLGANGSGKSTLLQLMGALLVPTRGSVRMFGMDAADPRCALEVRRRAAMVFQDPDDQIVSSSAADDIAFGPENLGLAHEEIVARVCRALDAVGMTAFAGTDPQDLSGGLRQRVALAGALAMEPSALLLDEPTSMLDGGGAAAFMRCIRERSRTGTTIVHATHRMDLALMADRVVVLDHGKVAWVGDPRALFTDGTLLRRLGLEAPFVTRARTRLAEGGIEIPPSTSLEAFADGLARALAARERPEDGPSRAKTPPAHAASRTPPAHAPGGEAPAIAFEGVSFSYAVAGGRAPGRRRRGAAGRAVPWALRDIDLLIPPHGVTAVVGPNGSGKSTLAALACAIGVPSAGTVRVAGIPSSEPSRRRELHRAVGLIAQRPERQLFAETVYDDIAFGPRNLGLAEDEVSSRVRGALRAVGLEADSELLARPPFALSGGQRRSVALAGILAMGQAILVMDEPEAGLDERSRRGFQSLLARLKAQGKTVLLVTHDMDEVARLADRVVLLAGGRIAAQGSPAQVFRAAREGAAPGLALPAPLKVTELLAARGVELEGAPLTLDDLIGGVLSYGVAP